MDLVAKFIKVMFYTQQNALLFFLFALRIQVFLYKFEVSAAKNRSRGGSGLIPQK